MYKGLQIFGTDSFRCLKDTINIADSANVSANALIPQSFDNLFFLVVSTLKSIRWGPSINSTL